MEDLQQTGREYGKHTQLLLNFHVQFPHPQDWDQQNVKVAKYIDNAGYKRNGSRFPAAFRVCKRTVSRAHSHRRNDRSAVENDRGPDTDVDHDAQKSIYIEETEV